MKTWRWLAMGLACLGTLTGCGGNDHNEMPTRFALTALVSDVPGAAAHTDANLVNGWGVAFNPTGFVWVADNGTNKSTLYDGNGVPQTLVVSIPPGTAGDALPTGIVFSGGTDFVVSANGVSGPSRFIFAGQAGTIAGWAPNVNLNSAITVVDGAAASKSYLGLALAAQGTANRLYATDFHNHVVDVYDGSFALLALPGAFTDPALPAGYAPFGIQALGGRIYVTYAQQDTGGDEVKGAGLGVVDVYDTAGVLIRRLATGGTLNAPWGLALAPADFGSFSNALLVGNFGDGRINAFDPNTGALLGTLSDMNGNPIVVDGLWGMAFGNGLNNQPANTLFVAAGPDDESHGLYARIDMR
jgi:uncharacterized protein (TIGR03118 family)